jgi:hypothetical protein
MQRHSDPPGGITLTEREEELVQLYLQMVVEDDIGTHTAARYVLSAVPHPDPDFVEWLLQGEVADIRQRH